MYSGLCRLSWGQMHCLALWKGQGLFAEWVLAQYCLYWRRTICFAVSNLGCSPFPFEKVMSLSWELKRKGTWSQIARRVKDQKPTISELEGVGSYPCSRSLSWLQGVLGETRQGQSLQASAPLKESVTSFSLDSACVGDICIRQKDSNNPNVNLTLTDF